MNGSRSFVSIEPEELKFQFELEKQTYCDLRVTNTTQNDVAFKVKTTSPKKYFVRPNTGVIHAWDSCIIRVTLQAQRECPPDMIVRDKFLLQSTIVSLDTDTDTLPSNTFTTESGRVLKEHKLRVVYLSPNSAQEDDDDSNMSANKSSNEFQSQGSDIHNVSMGSALRHLKEQRDAAVQLTQQLRQELEMLRRNRQHKGDSGFSLTFSAVVALIGLMFGLFLKLYLSSSSSTV